MVSIDGTCKIIDFGIARYLADAGRPMTGGVCTRWYKPPEIAFGAKHYGFTVDVWSLGCILAELYMKEPIFRGEGAIDQLSRIFGIRGTPNVRPFKFLIKTGNHLARSDSAARLYPI